MTMTDIQNINLTSEFIENLFNKSECLTFDPSDKLDAFKFSKNLEKEYKKNNNCKRTLIKNKHGKFILRNNTSYSCYLHYFTDGTLIFGSRINNKELLDKYIKALEIDGYKVKNIYGTFDFPDNTKYDKFLQIINNEAEKRYPYQDEFYIEPFPTKEQFLDGLFTKNNICITATAQFSPECRKFSALFTNGRLIRTYIPPLSINSDNRYKPYKLFDNNYVVRQEEYVPEDYLKSIYTKASKYNWYVSPEEAQKQNIIKISASEKEKMDNFIENLIKNNQCLSITNPDPENEFLSPDISDYALFADGRLIRTKTYVSIDSLKKIFPNLNIKEEKVPEYYIPEIYEKLKTCQITAHDIYVDMMKHKAKDLKKLTKLKHMEALELCAKISGWKSWKELLSVKESKARRCISVERLKYIIYCNTNKYKNVAQIDYELYLKK